MAEIDAYFKTQHQAEEARRAIDGSLAVSVSQPVMVMPRNGRPWEIVIRSVVPDLPMIPLHVETAALSLITQFDGEVHTSAPSGNRFVNGLPKSVIDRYESEQV